MSKDEFETWAAKLPKDQQEAARGFFTVIRRGADKKLIAVPYSKAYGADLERAAKLLEEGGGGYTERYAQTILDAAGAGVSQRRLLR